MTKPTDNPADLFKKALIVPTKVVVKGSGLSSATDLHMSPKLYQRCFGGK